MCCEIMEKVDDISEEEMLKPLTTGNLVSQKGMLLSFLKMRGEMGGDREII